VSRRRLKTLCPQTFVVVMAVTLIAEILLILGWILTKANHGFELSDDLLKRKSTAPDTEPLPEEPLPEDASALPKTEGL
jgi:hypothetical protein